MTSHRWPPLLLICIACTTGSDLSRDGGLDGSMQVNMDGSQGGSPKPVPAPNDAASDGAAEVDSEPALKTFEAFCNDWSLRVAQWGVKCRGARPTNTGSEDILSRCANIAKAIAANRVTFDPVAAAKCSFEITNESCWSYPLAAPCDDVLVPNTPLGGECAGDPMVSTCKEGFCSNAACHRVCTRYTELGAPCDRFGERQCSPDAECADGICTSRLSEGAPCGASTVVSCERSLRCIEGKCVAPGGVGATCAEGTCADALLCVKRGETESHCVPAGFSNDACDADAPCFHAFMCKSGKCVTLVDEGDLCRYDSQCPNTLRCLNTGDGRRCRAPGAQGASCTLDALGCAQGLTCGTGGICEPLSPVDAACGPYGCLDGLYCKYPDPNDRNDPGVCKVIGGEGDPCGSGPGRFNGAGISCVEGAVCVRGLCRTGGKVGDDCIPSNDDTCDRGLWCPTSTSKCTAPSGKDGPCHTHVGLDISERRERHFACELGSYCACESGSCDDGSGKCTLENTLGEECTDYACASSLICGANRRCVKDPSICD